GNTDRIPVSDKIRIVIMSLIVYNIPIIEALGISVKVPFAKNSGLVSLIVQHFGKGRLVAVKSVPVHPKAVDMAKISRKDYCSARSTDRIGTVAAVKDGPVFGDPINVGSWCELSQGIPIGTDSLYRMVVRHNIDDIRLLEPFLFPFLFHFLLLTSP